MKLNIKLIAVFSIATLLAFSGCKKGDDYFINPNQPEAVTPGLLLTSIEVSTFNTYESDLVKRSSIYMQQNAGVEGQSLQVNNYIVTEQDFSSTWSQPYQTLLSCKQLNDQFGEKNPVYSGIADILAVMNWGILTDMWGDIPFSDALKGGVNNYQSKYDKQEDVYKGMMSLLDSAIIKLEEGAGDNENIPESDDLVFNGDKKAWVKVAYSLKARYLNRLSKKSTYDPAAILDAISKGIASSDDDFISSHSNESGATNQWFDFQNNRYRYILAALPFVDSFKLRPSDLRLYSYFDTTNTNAVIGSPVESTNPNASEWGDYLAGKIIKTEIDSDDGSRTITRDGSQGIRFISFMEMKFIEAEVKARQGDATAAKVLNDAIQASCKTITNDKYDGSDIATYTAANTNVSRVIYEKWLALFGSAEPYNDYRRTGFPALVPNQSGVLNVIPKRNPTPSVERTGNPNAPVVSPIDPVWFAQ